MLLFRNVVSAYARYNSGEGNVTLKTAGVGKTASTLEKPAVVLVIVLPVALRVTSQWRALFSPCSRSFRVRKMYVFKPFIA